MKNSALIIGMGFFNYDDILVEEFRNHDWNVDYYTHGPLWRERVGSHVPEAIRKAALKRHQDKILKRIEGTKYDLILVVVGRYLSEQFVRKMRGSLSEEGRAVLYLWDDIKRVANFQSVRSYYDEIYSFDPVDCYREGFLFLPLFYESNPVLGETDRDIDVYSAFGDHSGRKEAAEYLVSKYPNRKMMFFVVMSFLTYFKKRKTFVRSPAIKYRMYFRVPSAVNISYMKRSKALFDIQFQGQSGLTMRTIETLKYGTKLVTSNCTIPFYNFYDKQNIQLCDEKKPEIDFEMLEMPYVPIEPKVLGEYSVRSWVDCIISGRPHSYLQNGIELADVYRAVEDGKS